MKKRLLIKKERKVFVEELGRDVTVSGFEKHLAPVDQDFHTKHGIIRKEALMQKPGSPVMVGKQEYLVLDPDFLDLYKSIRRHAQIITLKDIGAIIATTGINRNSKVLNAGAGSGAIDCYIAMIAKKIVSYDIDERSLEVSRENIKAFGFKNATVKEGSIYDEKKVSEKDFDVMILDVPEPWKAMNTAKKALKIGGFLVIYQPNITQMQEAIKNLPDEFVLEKTVEIIEREWAVDSKRTRPITKDHSHTGFLSFARKIR